MQRIPIDAVFRECCGEVRAKRWPLALFFAVIEPAGKASFLFGLRQAESHWQQARDGRTEQRGGLTMSGRMRLLAGVGLAASVLSAVYAQAASPAATQDGESYPGQFKQIAKQKQAATAQQKEVKPATNVAPGVVQLFAGTRATLLLNDIHNAMEVTGAVFKPGSLPPTVKVVAANPASPTSVSVTVEAGSNAHPATYSGQIRLLQKRPDPAVGTYRPVVPSIVPVRITVDAPDNVNFPSAPAAPSSDRIVTTDTGGLIVRDELIVLLARTTISPRNVATRIANTTGGEIIGSSFDDSFEIRYAVPSLSRLFAIGDGISAKNPEVVGVVPSVIFRKLAGVPGVNESPNNPWWNPVHMPDAWNAAGCPGNPAVPNRVNVAVVDGGFKETHPDLAGNVSIATLPGTPSTAPNYDGGHGTAVAGIIGAKWNNTGAAGVSCDKAQLKLVDFAEKFATFKAVFGLKHGVQSAIGNVASGGIVNISIDAHQNTPNPTLPITNECSPSGGETSICNMTYNQACALVMGQAFDAIGVNDLLVIIAAGNTSRNATNACPALLVPSYNNNLLVVGAMNAPVTAVRLDSNNGSIVEIFAPGTDIRTTFINNGYGLFTGTSASAPIVSGVAALLASGTPVRSFKNIKSCIVHSGQSIAGVNVLDAENALECKQPLPKKLDVVFAVDVTGSMTDEIQNIKTQIGEITTAIKIQVPDVRFGLITHEDYSGSFNSTPCGSGYAAEYGSATSGKPGGDLPFRLEAPLAAGPTVAFLNGVAGMQAGGGSDAPESYGRVFKEIATNSLIGFGGAPDRTRVVIDFGDNVPHDPELNQGIVLPPIASPFDRGRDPGPDNAVCTADDIDFQDGALTSLKAANIRLIRFDSSGDGNLFTYWRSWAESTGGTASPINPDGTSSGDLSSIILENLQTILAGI